MSSQTRPPHPTLSPLQGERGWHWPSSLWGLLLVMCVIAARDLSADVGAAAYLQEGLGARWLGMGGAARAAAWDVHAGTWNPAGLTYAGPVTWQVGSMLTVATLGRSSVSLSGSYLSDRAGAFGLSWIHHAVSGIERVDDVGTVTGTETSAEDAVLMSYGRRILYQVRAGATVKLLHQQLLGFSANGAAVDVGVLVQPLLSRELYLAVTGENLASTFAWETGVRNELTRAFAAGAAYRTFRDQVLLAADVVFRPAPLGSSVHAGAEVWPYTEVAVRAGINDGRPSGGATYFWKPYELDYAFVWDQNRLGNRHQVSFLLHF